jgi:hypothetical protein
MVAERVVRRGARCLGQGVEHGRLADIGQADDADGESHAAKADDTSRAASTATTARQRAPVGPGARGLRHGPLAAVAA